MVERLWDGVMLYHGSYCVVQNPDLEKCARYKDFGRGFYLTTDLEQARSFSILSLKKARSNRLVDASAACGFVSCFFFKRKDGLKEHVYEEADSSWLHCVVAHRKSDVFQQERKALTQIDIVGGKIANDATNATILTYMGGGYGEIGSEQADRICISLLLPERLKDQFCFRSKLALQCLTYRGMEKVSL